MFISVVHLLKFLAIRKFSEVKEGICGSASPLLYDLYTDFTSVHLAHVYLFEISPVQSHMSVQCRDVFEPSVARTALDWFGLPTDINKHAVNKY